MAQGTYLASKPRYEILDGLRGVASMLVIAFHLLETYSKGPAYQILNHGYLAVDFFFMLSGFVIGYAYDDRWDRMDLAAFFKRRLESERSPDFHRIHTASVSVPLRTADIETSPGKNERIKPCRKSASDKGRFLVGIPDTRRSIRSALHWREAMSCRWSVPGHRHHCRLPGSRAHRCGQQDHGWTEHTHLPVPRRNILSAVHYTFPACLHAGSVGQPQPRSAVVDAHRRLCRRLHLGRRHRLGMAQTL